MNLEIEEDLEIIKPTKTISTRMISVSFMCDMLGLKEKTVDCLLKELRRLRELGRRND